MKGTCGHRYHTTRPPAPPLTGTLTRAHWLRTPAGTRTPTYTLTFTLALTHTFSFTGAREHKGTLLCVHIHKLNKGLCLTCDEFGLFSFLCVNIFCKTN